jgi:hypothetical protein
MWWTMGRGFSTDWCFDITCDSEIAVPSETRAAADRRFSAVM